MFKNTAFFKLIFFFIVWDIACSRPTMRRNQTYYTALFYSSRSAKEIELFSETLKIEGTGSRAVCKMWVGNTDCEVSHYVTVGNLLLPSHLLRIVSIINVCPSKVLTTCKATGMVLYSLFEFQLLYERADWKTKDPVVYGIKLSPHLTWFIFFANAVLITCLSECLPWCLSYDVHIGKNFDIPSRLVLARYFCLLPTVFFPPRVFFSFGSAVSLKTRSLAVHSDWNFFNTRTL